MTTFQNKRNTSNHCIEKNGNHKGNSRLVLVSRAVLLQICIMILLITIYESDAFSITGKGVERKTTHLYDGNGSNRAKAEPLPLSTSDLKRLTELRSRHKTIPIMILDAMVPKQRMTFQSNDPKFHKLIDYVISGPQEIGMLGFNPHTGRPLSTGVTLCLTKDNILGINAKTNEVTITVRGHQRFEVQGEPRLDETESFYLADIEIVHNRKEDDMPTDRIMESQKLSEKIPDLVQKWIKLVIETKRADKLGMDMRIQDIGVMPEDIRERALWVAALVNPIPALNVCSEIRPAMLSCRNNYDRMILACAALQSSIDHLAGKKELL